MSDYTISDLEQLSGVPRRTIYFYVQQGILPPPSGAGLAARYQPAHLWRLRAIPRLRAAGWRLDRIRTFFSVEAEEELEAIANGRALAEPSPPPAAMRLAGGAAEPIPAGTEGEAVLTPTPMLRYRLTPGVELLVEADRSPDRDAQVRRLLAVARSLFTDEASGANESSRDPSNTG